ncbi:MAG TPA: NADH-ubiquinone oxidoreductase-F iron-sulfur binding region domain-containing protein [Candidatus Nanopelagicaceae bacterium]
MTATTIYVPRDSAARSVGADEVALSIAKEAALRKIDIVTVRNGSRGALWLEPLVEIATEQGRIAYGPVEVSDINSLFDADFLRGGSHPLALGKTEEIPWLARQDRITFARVGINDPLSCLDYEKNGGLVGLRRALEMKAEEIVAEVTESGVRGRGGAGFPAGIKWRTVLQADSDLKYICCNADEGDSGTFADRMLMEGDPFTLIEGMTIAAVAVGAREGVIYLRSEYPDAIATIRQAIDLARANGWLGRNILGTGKEFDLRIRVGAGSYVCGEETAMLESIEGKRGVIRSKPPLPAIYGLFGKPTVINNVLTLASIPAILADGAAAYKSRGVGRSLGTQVFQLAGNIARGGIVETAFGVTLDTLVNDFGAGTLSGRPVRAVQIGGPLGAYFPITSFSISMDYESLLSAGGMLGHGGIVVFDESVDLAVQAKFAMEFCAIESCGKCTPCRLGSTRGAETIQKIMDGDDLGANKKLLLDLCEVMTDGSLCALGGLTPMPVKSAMIHFPEDFDSRTERIR